MAALDELDRRILISLQEDATRPLEDVARRVGSSKTPVWNRIKKLRDQGVIRGQVAILDPDTVGLRCCFYVLVRTARHDAEWIEQFLHALKRRPEILEAHRLAGDVDYILKVRVANARAYDRFYQALIGEVNTLTVGGQELWLDDVCAFKENVIGTSCLDFNEMEPGTVMGAPVGHLPGRDGAGADLAPQVVSAHGRPHAGRPDPGRLVGRVCVAVEFDAVEADRRRGRVYAGGHATFGRIEPDADVRAAE